MLQDSDIAFALVHDIRYFTTRQLLKKSQYNYRTELRRQIGHYSTHLLYGLVSLSISMQINVRQRLKLLIEMCFFLFAVIVDYQVARHTVEPGALVIA